MGGFGDLHDSVFLLRTGIHEFVVIGSVCYDPGGVLEVYVGIGHEF